MAELAYGKGKELYAEYLKRETRYKVSYINFIQKCKLLGRDIDAFLNRKVKKGCAHIHRNPKFPLSFIRRVYTAYTYSGLYTTLEAFNITSRQLHYILKKYKKTLA